MIKKINCLFLCFLFFCCACTGEKQEVDAGLFYIYRDSLTEKNGWRDMVNKCRFIKLETTPECLIRSVKRIEFDDDKIFIKDHVNRLFVFDSEGNFLHTIGEVGNGPDEQLNMYDFYVDKRKQIVHVFDILRSTFFEYNYSGELLQKNRVEGHLFSHTSTMTLLNDNSLLLCQENQTHSLFNYRLLNLTNNEWKGCFPYPVTGEMTMAFGQSTVGKSGENVYASAFLSDTIYRYDRHTGSLLPQWVFKGKFKPAKKEDFEGKEYELGLEAMQTLRSKKRSFGIDVLHATNQYLYFNFCDPEGRYEVFYDMDSRTGFYNKRYADDTSLFYGRLITATDDAFVGIISVDEVIDEEVVFSPVLKRLLENSREDDNPILVFYSPDLI